MDDGQLASIRKAERESHLAVYDAFPLYAPGSWLAKPVKTVLELLPRFAGYSSLRALDLGCGVGRNSIPVARAFAHIPCRVDCVDILEKAIKLLRENAIRYGVAHVIRGIPAAMDEFEIAPGEYDLILTVSALEHCDCRASLEKKLRQIRDGLRPGGIACLVINSGITERDSSSGVALTPQFEVNLPTGEWLDMLHQTFDGWETLRQTVVHQKYEIPRSGSMAMLETDVVTWVGEKGSE